MRAFSVLFLAVLLAGCFRSPEVVTYEPHVIVDWSEKFLGKEVRIKGRVHAQYEIGSTFVVHLITGNNEKKIVLCYFPLSSVPELAGANEMIAVGTVEEGNRGVSVNLRRCRRVYK